jgi:hypothetical protein
MARRVKKECDLCGKLRAVNEFGVCDPCENYLSEIGMLMYAFAAGFAWYAKFEEVGKLAKAVVEVLQGKEPPKETKIE